MGSTINNSYGRIDFYMKATRPSKYLHLKFCLQNNVCLSPPLLPSSIIRGIKHVLTLPGLKKNSLLFYGLTQFLDVLSISSVTLWESGVILELCVFIPFPLVYTERVILRSTITVAFYAFVGYLTAERE